VELSALGPASRASIFWASSFLHHLHIFFLLDSDWNGLEPIYSRFKRIILEYLGITVDLIELLCPSCPTQWRHSSRQCKLDTSVHAPVPWIFECLTDPINSNEPALESAASIATYWHILKHVETLTNLIQCSKLANHVWWRPVISCHIHVLTPGAALASFLLAPVLILLPSCLLAIQHVFSLFLSSPCELG
jgi:hypothetical protein